MTCKELFNRASRALVIGAVGLAGVAVTFSARAEVGYSMRKDVRPFKNWGSAFNLSAKDITDEQGLAWASDKLKIRPTLSLGLGYMDNVYLSHDNEIGDEYYNIAPGIMLVYGSQDDDYITLNYSYDMTRYFDETVLDYDSHLFSGSVRMTPGAWVIHLQDQFSDSLDVDRETTRRTAKIHNSENLFISRPLSGKTAAVLSQAYMINDYKDDQYLDYDEYWIGGDLFYAAYPKLKLFGGLRYGIVDMKDSDVIGDADYLCYSVGAQGSLTKKTTMHARLSLQSRDFDDDRIKDIDEWTTVVGISSRYSALTSWGIDVGRALTPSSQREGHTQCSTTVTPFWQHLFWHRKMSLTVDGTYEWREYYDLPGKEDRDDRFWYINVVWDWNITKTVTAGLGYTHSRQDSDYDEYDYKVNDIYAHILLNF